MPVMRLVLLLVLLLVLTLVSFLSRRLGLAEEGAALRTRAAQQGEWLGLLREFHTDAMAVMLSVLQVRTLLLLVVVVVVVAVVVVVVLLLTSLSLPL